MEIITEDTIIKQDELNIIVGTTSDQQIKLFENEGINKRGSVVKMITEPGWSKSLKGIPVFTLKEIEQHRQLSGKNKGLPIAKTLLRGRKFQEEGYLRMNTLYTLVDDRNFRVKCKCKASMKAEYRNVNVMLSRKTGEVLHADCSCPAGMSGYCNHVMALLLQIAEFSLKGLKSVPQEVACTSRARQWGIPGNKEMSKAPVMGSVIKKQVGKQGKSSTLYDPRVNFNDTLFRQRVFQFQQELFDEDIRIGFAHCIPNKGHQYTDTKYGQFLLGSPLSFHLQPLEDNFKLMSNIENSASKDIGGKNAKYVTLPLRFIPKDEAVILTTHSELEETFLEKIKIGESDSWEIENKTINQSKNDDWYIQRKYRITSSNAHKVLIRLRNFDTLVNSFINNEKPCQHKSSDSLEHGTLYEPIARETYKEIMKYKLKRNISIRETGFVVQPSLYWLGASPDGLVCDNQEKEIFGLLEIKCPKTKRNSTPKEMLTDKSFYVTVENGQPVLKKTHSYGYYTQIQMAMGLCQASYCDFVVYTFKGMIIIRVPFDEPFFKNAVKKLTIFYQNLLLPRFIKS